MQRESKRKIVMGLSILSGLAGAVAGFAYTRTKRLRIDAIHRFKDAVEATVGKIEPRPGDILLFHHAHGKSLVITLFTHSPFYHSAIYAGDGHVIEARPQGVIHNSLAGREGDFVVIKNPYEKGPEALAWAKQQLGAKYDRTDVLVIILEHIFTHLRLNYTPRGQYTCAEFVATAYDRAGVRLIPDRDLDALVPADFERLLPPGALPES